MSTDTETRSNGTRPRGAPTTGTPTSGSGTESPPGGALPPLPSRRNPRWVALGVLALCLGALLSYVVYARVAEETTVVSAAQTVYRGEVLERADLSTVRVRGGTLPDTLPAADLDQLVGQRAVFDLPAGTLVTGAAVSTAELPTESGRSWACGWPPAGRPRPCCSRRPPCGWWPSPPPPPTPRPTTS